MEINVLIIYISDRVFIWNYKILMECLKYNRIRQDSNRVTSKIYIYSNGGFNIKYKFKYYIL